MVDSFEDGMTKSVSSANFEQKVSFVNGFQIGSVDCIGGWSNGRSLDYTGVDRCKGRSTGWRSGTMGVFLEKNQRASCKHSRELAAWQAFSSRVLCLTESNALLKSSRNI